MPSSSRGPRQVLFRLEAQLSGTKSARFFWSDWVSDHGLRACSLAARGLWMECLCICSASGGYLRINERTLLSVDIAKIIGVSLEQIEILLRELELNGVFSRNHAGTIYCRRMIRSEKARKNGRLGGIAKSLKIKETPDLLGEKACPHIPLPEPIDKKERTFLSRDARARDDHYPLPDNWEPNSDHFLLADRLGYFSDRVAVEAAAMRDWAKAEAKTKANWDAFFSKWLRDPRAKPNGGSNDRKSGTWNDATWEESINRHYAKANDGGVRSSTIESLQKKRSDRSN